MGAPKSLGHTSRHSPAASGASVVRLLAAALSIAAFPFGSGSAQTPRPTISVTETISAAAATQMPLAIRVGPPDALPKGSFIRIRGLPPTVALSEGHSIAPGSWAVPIVALRALKITLPAAAAGKSAMVITLVSVDGSVLAEAKSVLTIAPRQPAGRAERTNEPPPVKILRAGPPERQDKLEPSQASPPVSGQFRMAPEKRERALRFMKRGNDLLAQGGIAQARLLYERAAEAGLAQAAMALAGTYDEAELNRLQVRGLQPDRAAAMRWYERARQLGAAEADQRLRRLGAN